MTMTNTLLTLHDPELARRYYEQGLWRRDTLYSLLTRHAERRPDAFAVRDGARRLTWRKLLAMVDAVAADLHEAGLKRGDRVSIWLPNRVEVDSDTARLLTSGLCLQPLAASELPGRRDRGIAVTHPGGGIVRTARLRRRCADRRHLRRRPGAALVAPPLFPRRQPQRHCAIPDRTGAAARARSRSRQDRLSRLYFGHDRHAQRRHAFGQHLAGEWPRHGRRLGPRRALGIAEPEPDEPSYRRCRGRADDGGRARTRRQCARRAAPRSTGSSKLALPM